MPLAFDFFFFLADEGAENYDDATTLVFGVENGIKNGSFTDNHIFVSTITNNPPACFIYKKVSMEHLEHYDGMEPNANPI